MLETINFARPVRRSKTDLLTKVIILAPIVQLQALFFFFFGKANVSKSV